MAAAVALKSGGRKSTASQSAGSRKSHAGKIGARKPHASKTRRAGALKSKTRKSAIHKLGSLQALGSKSSAGKLGSGKSGSGKSNSGKLASGKLVAGKSSGGKPALSAHKPQPRDLAAVAPQATLARTGKPPTVKKRPASHRAALPSATATVSSNMPPPQTPRMNWVPREAIDLRIGTAGDHAALQHFMATVMPSGGRELLSASFDDPFYEPSDRLLVFRNRQVVAHVQIVERTMRFGALLLPVARLYGLGSLPEFRNCGYEEALLDAALERLKASGTTLVSVCTSAPQHFLASGQSDAPTDKAGRSSRTRAAQAKQTAQAKHAAGSWAICGRHSHARVNTRSLLSQLSARGVIGSENTTTIRPWRQVELASLMQTYTRRSATLTGALERTEAYWRWLIGRGQHDRLLVAVEGPDRLDADLSEAPIAGYVVTKEDRILELIVGDSPQAPHIAEQLLARACGEAIERDYHSVRLHVAPGDALLGPCRDATGAICHGEAFQGQVWMSRLLDPLAFPQLIAVELQHRLAQTAESRVELGLWIDAQRYALTVSRRGVRLERNGKRSSNSGAGRNHLQLTMADYTRLMLGHGDVADMVDSGRIHASTRRALRIAQTLFPQVGLWQPPWDEVF